MPIQLPQLKALGPSAPVSEGQIDFRPADSSKFVAAQSGMVEKTLSAAQGLTNRFEEDAAELAAVRVASDFEVKYKTKLRELKGYQGDPTEAYAKFDEESTGWANDAIAPYSGASSRVKDAINARLAKKNYELRDTRSVNEEMQYQAYETRTTDGAVALAKENVLTAAEMAKGERTADGKLVDPGSFAALANSIDEIKDLRIKSGMRKGLVSDTGEQAPSLKMQVKKDVSEAIKDTVETLNAAGRTAEADEILNRYQDDLLADTKAKLFSVGKESKTLKAAAQEFDSTKGMAPMAALAKLDKIKDPLIRIKAIQLHDDDQRRRENMQNRGDRQKFESGFNYLEAMKKQGKGFVSVTDAENDPQYARITRNLDPTMRAKLERMIESPRVSDPAVKAAWNEKLFSKERLIEGMTPVEFQMQTAGMSDKDKARANRQWVDANTDTPSERYRAETRAGTSLRKQAIAQGLIKPDENGKLSLKDKQKLTAYEDDMQQFVDKMPTDSPKEINQWVSSYVLAKKKGEVFAPAERKRFAGRAGAPPPPPNQKKFKEFTSSEQNEILKGFAAKNGSAFKAGDEGKLQDYINSRGKS